ncbi:hypothetical protein BJ165DRAFT_1431590 [Panaeolus papilionaceus]|nr:hypothetical protein BJ165DRAFT_1431590 [Panaeolus papilionaceus]
MTRLSVILVLIIQLSTFVTSTLGAWNNWEATNFCKCICFATNYTILPLNLPDNPSQPCLSCTKQWCLNQNLPACAGAQLGNTNPDTATGKEGDVEARCFQRDSPRDQLIVTLFLLTVFGLLLGAGIKSRILKTGIVGELPWNRRNQTRWWEPWIPQRQDSNTVLGLSRFGLSAREEQGDESDDEQFRR